MNLYFINVSKTVKLFFNVAKHTYFDKHNLRRITYINIVQNVKVNKNTIILLSFE